MNTAVNGYYARVALSFSKNSDVALIAFVRNVITLMTGNATYPTPMPPLAVLTTQVDTFETAVHTALDGGRIPIANRNAERTALLTLLRQLASYVQTTCQDDLPLLLGSGFQAVRAPSPVGVLPAPQGTVLTMTGITGELLVKWGRLDNAANYTVQVASTPDGPWESKPPVTPARLLLQGLTPLKTYWARVCGNGSAGAGGWSGTASGIVL